MGLFGGGFFFCGGGFFIVLVLFECFLGVVMLLFGILSDILKRSPEFTVATFWCLVRSSVLDAEDFCLSDRQLLPGTRQQITS